MERIRQIVVGVDLLKRGASAGGLAAVHEAQWLAERTKASIALYWSSDGWRGSEGDARTLLEPLAKELAEAGVHVKGIEVDGHPAWLGLIRRALAGDAELIVCGRRATRQAGGRPLGFNTHKLLRKCPAPVWAVSPRYDWAPRRVMAATDLSAVGDEATRMGAGVARLADGELHIVHAWQLPFELQMERARLTAEEYRARRQEIEEDARARIRKGLEGFELPSEVQTHLHCDAPHRAIVQETEQLDPDLLVMGTLSHSRIAGLLMGSTAERILAEVECSLLTVKPQGFESPVRLTDDDSGAATSGGPKLLAS